MLETSLVVQWLGLCASTEAGKIPDLGNNILHALWHGQRRKKKLPEVDFQPMLHIQWVIWCLCHFSSARGTRDVCVASI